MNQPLTPDSIMQLGFGFAGAKVLLSAVELGLFTRLAERPGTLDEVAAALELHPRGARDFLDALVALRLLDRDASGVYRNAPEADAFLDRDKPGYVGGILEMANARLYRYWGSLTDALRTGRPQNEAKDGADVFAAIYADPARLRGFLRSMTGLSAGAARALAEKFAWRGYKTFADLGCAQGGVPVTLARAHAHLVGVGFDLPVVRPVFEAYVAEHGVDKRVKFVAGDLFATDAPFPPAEVLIFGHILHDWGLARKRQLLAKAFASLPVGGAVIVYDCMIDDARREHAFGFIASLNMLIETHEGSDYTPAECRAWMADAGFRHTRVEHLAGPETMVVGVK